MNDLEEQNRVLRERVAQLENALDTGTDPLLRALAAHAPGYLNVVSPEGRMLATARPSEGFGSVIGRSAFEFIEPEHHAAMQAAFDRVVATRQPASFESVGFGEDGSPGHSYLTRVFPLVEGDTVIALVLAPTDITDRVRLERSLLEQQQALRLAIEASRIGMWRWDVASGEITWDARMQEIWGVSGAPASYEDYMTLLHADDRALVQAVVREALETGVYRTLEHRIAARPGYAERWVLAAATVHTDAAGKPIRLMGGALDITEQKHLTARLNRAERVESIGQLTAGIAHNFNNLLAAVVPNLELALVAATGVNRDRLTVALDASLQARDLVRNLMSLTQRGGVAASAPAHPGDVVSRMEALCRLTFPREISLEHEIAPDVGHVGMPTRDLEQVLLNLLFNARDAVEASPRPEREIVVSVDQVEAGGDAPVARIRVRDSGVGMSPDVRQRIFEPFFTTKPPHKGSGLGLSNAVQRVQDAGGQLLCESAPGAGTTFTLLLPTRAVATPSRAPEVPQTEGSIAATILVVDDEPLVRRVVRHVLEDEGCTVLDADSADAARAALERQGGRVDLVILDQSMPRESGVEALPSLRRLTSAPVVLFTGMAPELPQGIAALLEKPARPGELAQLVRRVLGERRSTSSPT